MNISNELIYQIIKYLNTNEIKCLSLVNKKIREICLDILFTFPRFKRRFPSEMLGHLPIQIIKNSYLSDFISPLPNIHTIILDSRYIYITPNFIKRNLNILFLICLDYIYPFDRYHFSNFLSENVKLFTNSDCWITIKSLIKFKKFKFQHICLSHIEEEIPQKTLLNELSQMNIDRIHIDCDLYISPVCYSKLINLKITSLSSSVFQNTNIPIHIFNELRSLEVVHFKKNCRFLYEDFKKIKYTYIKEIFPPHNYCYCEHEKIYKKPITNLLRIYSEIAIVRRNFLLYIRPRPRWVQQFEQDYIRKNCSGTT